LLFPDGDAVGQLISLSREVISGGAGAEVIGIVGDVLYDRPEQGVMAEAFFSMRQGGFGSTIALRTSGDPLAAVAEARTMLADLDPDIPMSNIRTLEALAVGTTSDTRLLANLLAVFASLTLILAATGVWAVVANRVAQRTKELGLRMALGADSAGVIRLVLKQGLILAGCGIAVGTLTVWGLSRVLTSLLFGVSPMDPASVLVGASALVGVTALAAYLPARRAVRIDPMVVLRSE
jgi:predicted lysophospholipase L1 biosynthesis ABC-type transport system permease subunit